MTSLKSSALKKSAITESEVKNSSRLSDANAQTSLLEVKVFELKGKK